jgi:hypothetical protein
MKQKYFIATGLLAFLLCFKPAIGKTNKGIDDPDAKYGGFSIIQSNNGAGFGGFYEYAINASSRLTANIHLLIVHGKNDYPIYNPYDPYGYTYERADKTRLSFIPVLVGYKRILFVDKLANNFRPYLQIDGGFVTALDPANVPDFSDRMKNMEVYYTGILRAGAGMDFMTTPRTLISVFLGYEYLKFANKIDLPYELPEEPDKYYTGRKDFTGITIKVSIGKKF